MPLTKEQWLMRLLFEAENDLEQAKKYVEKGDLSKTVLAEFERRIAWIRAA